MVERDIRQGPLTKSIVIKGYSTVGDIDNACKVLLEMIESNMRVSDITYGTILDACAKTGKMKLAMKIFEHLK